MEKEMIIENGNDYWFDKLLLKIFYYLKIIFFVLIFRFIVNKYFETDFLSIFDLDFWLAFYLFILIKSIAMFYTGKFFDLKPVLKIPFFIPEIKYNENNIKSDQQFKIFIYSSILPVLISANLLLLFFRYINVSLTIGLIGIMASYFEYRSN